MNPTLVVMAVRAALRLARTGQEAFGQYARDRAVMLPMLKTVEFPKDDVMIGVLSFNQALMNPDVKPALDSFMKAPGSTHVAGDADIVTAEFVRIQALLDKDAKPLADEATGLWMVQQWSSGQQPAGPVARLVLTIVDVAAEFAAQDPKLFGIGGNAEVVIQALATHVAEFIPDNTDDLGPRNRLGERLAGMFLKSALAALSEHPEVIIDQDQVQQLVKGTLPTLVAAFPDTLEAQMNWRAVLDSLLGPVAHQSMKALAQNPRAFFGKDFGDDGLLGPLTSTYLLKASELGFEQTFSRAGAVEIYKATIALAAARPELFTGNPAKASDKLLAQLFADLAVVARDHSPPFDNQLLAQLGAVTLEAAARAGGALLDPNQPWENVIAQTLTPVVAATSAALKSGQPGALRLLKSQANLENFVRIIVTQIAVTPGMVTGTSNPEVNRLVSALAAAMAADENLLLSQEDWMAVVAVAVEEVAANPGRLLGLDTNNPSEALLATLLKDLVTVAITQWKLNGRAGGTVLFGPTLREAMIILIRASASQAVAALVNSPEIKRLAAQVTSLVATKLGVYGSKEWLCLYRVLLTQVIDTGALPDPLDDATINAALAAITGVAA